MKSKIKYTVFCIILCLPVYAQSWDLGIDYNIKPHALRWVNLRLTGSPPSNLFSPEWISWLRLGISLDNGFYFPDFEENPGPTYREPETGETDDDVRLTGMTSAFSLNLDWFALTGALGEIDRLRYYAGPGVYFTGPAYYEIGVRMVGGVALKIFGLDDMVGEIFLEAAPQAGVELHSLWFAWEIEGAAGFRMKFGASK